jgi:4-amino-4-deoxy-L-arabinose transferase-like glycosyltransferase
VIGPTAKVTPAEGVLALPRRIVDRWYDRERDGSAVWILLAGFVATWTCFHIITYASIDLHPDLVEVFAWSRHPSLGYSKHPPLNALIAAAWFSVFPVADWSFHLLAMVNAAIALLAVDLIARRYLSGDKRLLVLLLLLLTPFYQFHGQRFSTNQTLLSTWPLATYCFLRAFESRRPVWASAAGGMAAMAMLGKYYSVYLIAAFGIAAILDPERRRYFSSASPWISATIGLLVLSPHLLWLWQAEGQPFHYALSAHSADTWWRVVTSLIGYLTGALGYVALPIGAYVLATRPNRAAWHDALWPSDPRRRMLLVLLAAPLLLPIVTAPIAQVQVTSLWTMSAWFLLPIVLLAPSTISLPREAAVNIGIAVLAITVVSLAAAPALAWTYHLYGTKEGRSFYRLASAEITRLWRGEMGTRLSIVTGDQDFSAAAAFYSPDHPDYMPAFDLAAAPWITPRRLEIEGWVAICRLDDVVCVEHSDRQVAGNSAARRLEIELTPSFLGYSGPSGRFVVILSPPAR